MSNKDKSQIASSYNASDVDAFEGLEAIRKRPEMYIGSRGSQGLHHLVWEVVDNSVDEYLAGYCSDIRVQIQKDGSMYIQDNGRGIPVDMHQKFNKPALEVLLTIPHSGGKFGGKGYSVSGGLHGIGVKAVNALSLKLTAQVKRDNQLYEMQFKQGQKTKDLTVIKKIKGETGTIIHFTPDPKIFIDGTDFDRKTIADRLHESAFLNPKLRILLEDLREDEPIIKEYYSENGIIELLELKTSKLKTLTKDIFQVKTEKTVSRKNPDTNEEEEITGHVNIVFQYTNSDNDNCYSYVNNIKTKDGEHVRAYKNAMIKAFNTAAREVKVLKDSDKDIKDKDVLSGIVSIVYVRFPDPRFESQTKDVLSSKEAYSLVHASLTEEATKFFKKNKALLKNIVTFAQEQEKMREELKATKETTQDTGLLFNDSLPGKLADCASDDISQNEVFIVEGDSAGGSAKQGRDRHTQAILSLKGKPLNVQGQKIKKTLDNDEFKALVASLGCGVKDMCDPDKSRYGKVIILTDADVDGAHIKTLLLTFFFHYLRSYVEAGRLFIAKPPLFKLEFKASVKGYNKDEVIYLYSDQELKDITNGLNEGSHFKIQRYKGLGEMNADQLWETTMDPKTRLLEQVVVQDIIQAEAQFETFMGGNNEDKVDFIKKVIKAYKMKKQNIKNAKTIEELEELDLSDDEVSKEIEKKLSQFTNVVEKNVALRAMTDILKESIGDYAYYVNLRRNIPDIRDGMKPVQRRILWAMYNLGMKHDTPYKKSARLVGEVIGKYHPHGDTAVYDAQVKLAQDFHENFPILDFHGNVGSIDGDSAAAMRYTETRMHIPAEDMLEDIEKNTVEFVDNYDYTEREPDYLPGKFPYVLVNGTQGIGVSIATNIPSHNLLEVMNAIKFVIDNPDCSIKEIMKYIKGPDFPTGGIVIDNGFQNIYETGNGTYKIRAKMHTEVIKGQQALVITEIPYNLPKERIVKKIQEVCRDIRKDGKIIPNTRKISDVIDYSDQTSKKDLRLVLILRKNANAEEVKQLLYKYTQLESHYKVNLLAIENDEIKIFSLKDIIVSYITHRQNVLKRKFQYNLKKKEDRKHLVEGYLKILRPIENLDKAIQIIKDSANTPAARLKLMKEFDLSELQADFILDKRLSSLSKGDVKKLQEELKQLKIEIAELKNILSKISLVNEFIKEDIDKMVEKYTYHRAIDILKSKMKPAEYAQYVKKTPVEAIIKANPIKRLSQIISADKIAETDQKSMVLEVEDIYAGLDVKSKIKKVKISEAEKVIKYAPKDAPLVNLVKTDTGQKLLGLTNNNYIVQCNLDILPFSTEKYKNGATYDIKKELKLPGRLDNMKINYEGKSHVIILYDNGDVEKVPISYFNSSEYKYEFKILDFLFVNEDDAFFISTKLGQLIVTEANQYKEYTKQKGISLDKKDSILSLGEYKNNGYLLVVTQNNYTNLVAMNEFTPQGKGGKGIRYYKQGSKTGLPIICLFTNNVKQNIYLESDKGDSVVTLDKIAELNNRNVIGKIATKQIKGITPLNI